MKRHSQYRLSQPRGFGGEKQDNAQLWLQYLVQSSTANIVEGTSNCLAKSLFRIASFHISVRHGLHFESADRR